MTNNSEFVGNDPDAPLQHVPVLPVLAVLLIACFTSGALLGLYYAASVAPQKVIAGLTVWMFILVCINASLLFVIHRAKAWQRRQKRNGPT